ncbi:hypothetical protein HK096_002355 [Nowakowskiella sp. JEL0078]|nr:hypothetical protein HK096_002355 [Nowakowskiella sp. JEL0078]
MGVKYESSQNESTNVAVIHRSSVIWILQKRIKDISDLQRELQDKRIAVNVAKKESLILTRIPAVQQKSQTRTSSPNTPKSLDGWEDDFPEDFINSQLNSQLNSSKAFTSPSNSPNSSKLRKRGNVGNNENRARSRSPLKHEKFYAQSFNEKDDWESDLTEEQLQLFEAENESLVARFENTLDQVRNTTQSLAEISAMQTQLTNLLTEQQSIVQVLHEEAITATETIISANRYLENAKKHFSDSRTWVIVFLLLASFILIFLDWYS